MLPYDKEARFNEDRLDGDRRHDHSFDAGFHGQFRDVIFCYAKTLDR